MGGYPLVLLVTFVSGFRLELMCDVRINLNRKFREASNCYKTVLEAAKLAYATKTKESITSQKVSGLLASC